MALMLDPPPRTFPIDNGRERPLRCGFGRAWSFDALSLPRLASHWPASMTLATSSPPPASSSRTLTSAFSASRRATTAPADPEPQMMKSSCGRRAAVSLCWLRRTRAMQAAAAAGLRSPAGRSACSVWTLCTPCSLRLLDVRGCGTACCQRSTPSPSLLSDRQHDLPDLFVGFHVVIRFDDLLEAEGFGDFRFELSALYSIVDVALGSREPLGIRCDCDLRQPIATNTQGLLESGYEGKGSLSGGEHAVFETKCLGSC